MYRATKTTLLAGTALAVSIGAAGFGLSPALAAGSDSWDPQPVTNVYNEGQNWVGGLVPDTAADTATFGSSDIRALTMSASTDVGAWAFQNNAGDYSVTNGAAYILQFSGAGISTGTNSSVTIFNDGWLQFNAGSTNGAATIHNTSIAIFLGTAGTGEINNEAGGVLAFGIGGSAGDAIIHNNGALQFLDASTAANAFIRTNSGGTTFLVDTASGGAAHFQMDGTGILDIVGATLDVTVGSISGASGSILLGANTLIVNDTAGDDYFFNGVISGTGGFTKLGDGTLALGGINTYTGTTTFAGGILEASADANFGNGGPLVFDGGTFRYGASFAINPARTITLNAGGGTVDTNGFDATITQPIVGVGAFIKDGDGALTLAGVNTYSGGTVLRGGILAIGNDNNLGDIAGGLTFDGGTLENTFDVTTARIITVTANGGTFSTNPGTTVTANGPVTLHGTLSKENTGTLVINGAVSGDGGFDVQDGILTLSGANTYEGDTRIFGGTLLAAGGSAIGDLSAVKVYFPGAFEILADEEIGSIEGDGLVTIGDNTLTTGGNNRSTTYEGAITGGPNGTLIKTGTGTFTLVGAQAYGGATYVDEGALFVYAPTLPGTTAPAVTGLFGDVFVATDATFGGNVEIDGNVWNDGHLAPGASPGTVAILGDYNAGPNATYGVDVLADLQDAPVNGTTHDFVSVAGNVTGVTQVLMNPSGLPVPTLGNGLEIVRVDGDVDPGAFFLDSLGAQTAENGFYDGFQYLLSHVADSVGTSDSFFLSTVVREELVANAAMLAAGRAATRGCFRGDERLAIADTPGKGGRAWASVKYGTLDTGSDAGAVFDSDYTCVNGGATFGIGNGMFQIGTAGGYSSNSIDLSVVQGRATLDGDMAGVEAVANFNSGRFFANLSGGYQSTDWSYQHALASGGVSDVTVDGVIGSLTAGYRIGLDGPTGLTLAGQVNYDGTDCGANCFLFGTSESTSEWEGRILAQLQTVMSNGALRPYVQVSLTDDLDDGHVVSFDNAVAFSDANSSLFGANAGLNARLGGNWIGFADASLTTGLNTDVNGYQGALGVRTSW